MALEKTWRWFGAKDKVSLSELKQMGVEGVVTSLHHIPAGDVWTVDEIKRVQNEIESYGMRWSVVESLPVCEGIKTASEDRARLLQNYTESVRNLGLCGIDTICYNFMPVLDWARTDLHFKNECGGESMLFDYPTFAAFDLFILNRPGAATDYPADVLEEASAINDRLTAEEKETIAHNIIVVTQAFIHGVVGEGGDYKQQFLAYLQTYAAIGPTQLREHLKYFLHAIMPTAEAAGVRFCIHPDDPPFPLLGLPRIASTVEDLQWIMDAYDSNANGITFCTGSLSARRDNDLSMMVKHFADRIHFVHLRNTAFLEGSSFYESGHLTGSVDMYTVVKVLLEEQIRRIKAGRTDTRIPFRPDHGIKILGDYHCSANPGYPLIGRLKGFAEIAGLEMGIARMLSDKSNVD